jgi:ribosomal protein S18 acetylase RimI-like enzyme
MELKIALLADIIDLKRICIDAYALNFHNHWNVGGLEWYLDKEFSTERLKSDLISKNTEYYFIQHELKTVGFIKIRSLYSTGLTIDTGVELEKIYVIPECKGMGIGKLALKEIIQRIDERGKKNLFLCVIDTNVNAIAFYEKLGFEFYGKTTLDVPYFKEELKGMNRMVKKLS